MEGDIDFGGFVTEFQRRLDAAESVADMLLPDARLISPSGTLDSADTIDAHVTARAANQIVRHGWSNLRVERTDGTHAILRYIATASHGDLSGALRMTTLGDVTDRLTRDTDNIWRLSESRFERIFKQIF